MIDPGVLSGPDLQLYVRAKRCIRETIPCGPDSDLDRADDHLDQAAESLTRLSSRDRETLRGSACPRVHRGQTGRWWVP